MNFHDLRISEITDIGELKNWDATHKEMLGEPLIILTAIPRETQYGLAFVCDCFVMSDNLKPDSEPIRVLMGATAIVNQLNDFEEELPLVAKVVLTTAKSGKGDYYMLTSWTDEEKAVYLDPDHYTKPKK